MKPKHEVAEIINIHRKAYVDKYSPALQVLKTLRAIQLCRTRYLGGNKSKCNCCGHQKISYNSCRNRHCPTCPPYFGTKAGGSARPPIVSDACLRRQGYWTGKVNFSRFHTIILSSPCPIISIHWHCDIPNRCTAPCSGLHGGPSGSLPVILNTWEPKPG